MEHRTVKLSKVAPSVDLFSVWPSSHLQRSPTDYWFWRQILWKVYARQISYRYSYFLLLYAYTFPTATFIVTAKFLYKWWWSTLFDSSTVQSTAKSSVFVAVPLTYLKGYEFQFYTDVILLSCGDYIMLSRHRALGNFTPSWGQWGHHNGWSASPFSTYPMLGVFTLFPLAPGSPLIRLVENVASMLGFRSKRMVPK